MAFEKTYSRTLALTALLYFASTGQAFAASSKCQVSFAALAELGESSPSLAGTWTKSQKKAALRIFEENIQANGAVAAAGGKNNAEYPFHWVRDAALVMDENVARLGSSLTLQERTGVLQRLKNYADFSKKNQETQTVVANAQGKIIDIQGEVVLTPERSQRPLRKDFNPGEPKFHLDGKSYDGEWGRPQNDGPALRATTLSRLLEYVEANPNHPAVRKVFPDPRAFLRELYDPKGWSSTIKRDLEYVAHHWKDPSFDLWEEVKGDHFYTRMVQRRALAEGAKLAERQGDVTAALFYREQAKAIEDTLGGFWDAKSGYIRTAKNTVGGHDYKASGLDSATILAVLHAGEGSPFPVTDGRVMATVKQLEQTFRKQYPINAKFKKAVAIGRYPEDRYCGLPKCESGGNPWVLLTNSFGDYYFRLANELGKTEKIKLSGPAREFYVDLLGSDATLIARKSVIERGSEAHRKIVDALQIKGDEYLAVVKSVTPATGRQSEQFNRINGEFAGAEDLTWNAASFLRALKSREAIKP